MMASLTETLKRIKALDTSEAKQQKLVDSLMAPVRELERVQAEKAAALKEQQAIEAQIAQLKYELAEDEQWLEDVTPHLALLTTGVDTLAAIEQLIVSRVPTVYQLDIDQYAVNRLWSVVRAIVQEQYPARRARADQLRARIAELGGE